MPAIRPTEQLSLATVNGEPWLELPDDLYIPPEALEIILEQFEGPLDLLLHLIRKQKLDIAQLPVLKITQQYMAYIEAMQQLKLELAAEYLVMAALLTEIKSRALLPQQAANNDEEDDPRQALIRRLQAYQLYQDAAEKVDDLPRLQRDTYPVHLAKPEGLAVSVIYPEVSLAELAQALQAVMARASHFEHHQVQREFLSTQQRMLDILAQLASHKQLPFSALFTVEEGRRGLVVSFLALLELLKAQRVKCIQAQALSEIHIVLIAIESEP